MAIVAFCVLASTSLALALIGRAMFYVLVIPTTMPGAFFWRNEGFAKHAKQTGLSASVDAGLVCEAH
ncbi:MAG: hypothetical protein HKO07_02115 [Pseudomonadales bacterium]|nr:hypothetical protein [Pseudomonadales bacterium]